MPSYECGYDEQFVDTPPEYLECTICCFVLREPVQVLECGHAFCSCCFDKFREHSSQSNSDLLCPLDKKVIDCGKVVKDRFTERIIADLRVYCKFKDDGCNWEGELRDSETHNQDCMYAQKGSSVERQCSRAAGDRIPAEVMKQIISRLDRCEEALNAKDKDIAHLKFNIKEADEKLEKHEEEIMILRQKVWQREEVCKQQERRLEELTREIGELKTGNVLHEKGDQKQEIGELHAEIEHVDNEVKVLTEEIKELKNVFGIGVDVGETSSNNESEGAEAGYIIENNIFKWGIDASEVKSDDYRYSPTFYCNTNGFACKLGVYKYPDNRRKFIFVPQDATNFPTGTIFNIELDSRGRDSQYENICRKELKYEQSKEYLLLHHMDQHEYNRFARYGYLYMRCTWGYQAKQTKK